MNPISLKALTWGTVITALVSALLLAVAGAMLPDREEAGPQPAPGESARGNHRGQAADRQHTPAGSSATDRR